MSFSTLSVNQSNLINNLSKYVMGVAINQTGEAVGIIPGVALMGGIQGSVWAWQNRKDYKGGFEKLKENAAARDNFIKSTQKYKPEQKFSKIRNKWAGAVEYTAKEEVNQTAARLNKKFNSPNMKNFTDSFLNATTSSQYSNADKLKILEKVEAEGDLRKYLQKVSQQRASGSFLRGIKDKIGVTKLSTASKNLAVTSNGFRTLMKGVKGNAGFAALSFGIGMFTDVIPAFKLGTGKGFKQLGKTAVKTGFEVGGWAAGLAIGAKAGAAIGTCIGGPAGTVVGGAIGLIGGFLGSLLFSKAADKIVGPSEIEIAQSDAARQIGLEAMQNFNQLDELTQTAYLQLVEHAASGNLSEDDLIAKESLEKIIGEKIDIDAAVKEYTALLETKSKLAPSQSSAQHGFQSLRYAA